MTKAVFLMIVALLVNVGASFAKSACKDLGVRRGGMDGLAMPVAHKVNLGDTPVLFCRGGIEIKLMGNHVIVNGTKYSKPRYMPHVPRDPDTGWSYLFSLIDTIESRAVYSNLKCSLTLQ